MSCTRKFAGFTLNKAERTCQAFGFECSGKAIKLKKDFKEKLMPSAIFMFVSYLILNVFTPLAAEEPSAFADAGNLQPLILIVLGVLLFYFILWRPEQKRRKALEDLRSSLKQGDKVTAIGIVGTVAEIRKDTTVLQMVDGSKIEVLTAAITDIHPIRSEKEIPLSET